MSFVRKEQIGDAQLYLGDCRGILLTLDGYDTVLTDPVWPNCPPDLLVGSDNPFALWAEAVALMQPAKRIVAVMRCDSDPRFLSAIPSSLPFFRSMQLPYVMPGYIGRVLGGDETAYWFGEPVKFQKGRQVVPGRAPLAQPAARAANGHPCSRALIHFKWLAEWCADDGETVLDPFMGSGTTGVACFQRGRKFVGIEIVPEFFELACKRIEKAQREPQFAELSA